MSDGTLMINDVVVEASEFAYDGCHKIYLPEVWEEACPLRFISSADLSERYVEQCQTACVRWEPAATS